MTNSTRMSAQEYEEKKHKLRTLSAQNNELARLILVEGLSKTKAAAAVGMSPQNVSGAMKRVMALLTDLPSDYVYFQEWMPAKMAAEVRKELKRLEIERQNKKSNISK